MLEINNKHKKCTICTKNYTSVHVEITPGNKVYVCKKCEKAAEDNFIWLCMDCGRSYVKPKGLVIAKIRNNYKLKMAYMIYEDMMIIQGINCCMNCNPKRKKDFVETNHVAIMEC